MTSEHRAILEIEVTDEEQFGFSRLRLTGELDEHESPAVALALSKMMEAGTTMVVADLTDLSFLDLAGARLLAAAAGLLRQRDGALAIVGGAPLTRVLTAVGLASRLRDAADFPPALPGFREGAPLVPSPARQAELIIRAERADARPGT